MVFGLDRLDYTKAVPERLDAFEGLLRAEPTLAGRAMLAQWSAPSREGVAAYRLERERVEAGAARIQALGGDVDLRLEVLPAPLAAAALRDAEVCLVTSVADGMNLVAKEFVAARDDNHGVLVLSTFAGAALDAHAQAAAPVKGAYGEAYPARPIRWLIARTMRTPDSTCSSPSAFPRSWQSSDRINTCGSRRCSSVFCSIRATEPSVS